MYRKFRNWLGFYTTQDILNIADRNYRQGAYSQILLNPPDTKLPYPCDFCAGVREQELKEDGQTRCPNCKKIL